MPRYYLNKKLIKDFMKEHKLKTKEFCKQCGISAYMFRKMQKGCGQIGFFKIVKIADYMKVRIANLVIQEFYNEDEKEEYYKRINKYRASNKK